MQDFCPRINMLKGIFFKTILRWIMVCQKVPKLYFQSQLSKSCKILKNSMIMTWFIVKLPIVGLTGSISQIELYCCLSEQLISWNSIGLFPIIATQFSFKPPSGSLRCQGPILFRPVHVLLSRFYLNFILILSKFYPAKIRIKSW